MSVYQLLIHSCVLLTFNDGSMKSKICDWDDRGLFKYERFCRADGYRQTNTWTLTDTAEQRWADEFRCLPTRVN